MLFDIGSAVYLFSKRNSYCSKQTHGHLSFLSIRYVAQNLRTLVCESSNIRY